MRCDANRTVPYHIGEDGGEPEVPRVVGDVHAVDELLGHSHVVGALREAARHAVRLGHNVYIFKAAHQVDSGIHIAASDRQQTNRNLKYHSLKPATNH